MSYALSTTKRKFHRILDSISNRSATSIGLTPRNNASSATLPPQEPPTKRLRPTRPLSAHVAAPSQAASAPKTPPTFVPWDRERFLQRLETFRSVSYWMPKPERMNEVQWAKRGWVCVGVEVVRCTTCARELCVDLLIDDDEKKGGEDGADWTERAREELADKYAALVVSGHSEDCLWRGRGCDATIHRLSVVNPAKALEALRLRYESLVKIKSDLPSNITTPDDLDMESISEQYAAIFLPRKTAKHAEPDATPELVHIGILSLALFGWEGGTDLSTEGTAKCTACFRCLGLWLFRSRPRPGMEDDVPIVSKLYVDEQHRDYCPWINATTQSGGQIEKIKAPPQPKLSGWEMAAQHLRNAQHMRHDLAPPTPRPASRDADVASEIVSLTGTDAEDRDERDAKDRERWAKVKKLKQAFSVKRRVRPSGKENLPKSNIMS